MPVDEFKTLPHGFSVTQLMQPVAWAVEYDDGIQEELFLRVADAQYYAKVSSELSGKEGFEGRVVPLYRSPPAAVEPRVPIFPSEFATLAAVAIAEEPRHDEPTCCGERQVTECRPTDAAADETSQADVGDGWRMLEVGEIMASGDEIAMCNGSGQIDQWVKVYEDSLARGNTVTPHLYGFCRRRVTAPPATTLDVGDGWRELGPDDVLQEGDQCDVGANEPCWVNTVCVGDRAGDGCVGGGCDRYRRRVTPPAPELSPDAVSAMCQRNERDALLKKIATLRSEAEQQQEIILHAGLEVERLGNACEAYTTEIVRLRSEVERLRRAANSWERESVAHAEEVERLRLTLDEREALAWCRDVIPAMACKSAVIARIHAACCGKMLKRLGGGE